MWSVTLLQDWLPANYHHQMQETWHVSLPFITTRPATDSASPGDLKFLNRSGKVFCGSFKLGRHTVHVSCSAYIDPEVKRSGSHGYQMHCQCVDMHVARTAQMFSSYILHSLILVVLMLLLISQHLFCVINWNDFFLVLTAGRHDGLERLSWRSCNNERDETRQPCPTAW